MVLQTSSSRVASSFDSHLSEHFESYLPYFHNQLSHDLQRAIKSNIHCKGGYFAMATTYALPSANLHNGHGHSHSHGRKSATERLPLRPTSTNGGLPASNGHFSSDLLKSQTQHNSHKSIDVFSSSNQLSFDSNQQRPDTLQLPTPSSFSTPTTSRSKSMERRKSVGLPTHLRLEKDGYGFPPPSGPQVPTIDEEIGKRYLFPSCMTCGRTWLTKLARNG